MAETGLFGPHSLNVATIDRVVTGIGPGAYALGRADGTTYYVGYVGRSDDDLNGRLKKWVDSYAEFKYAFYDTPLAAFQKECRLYHDFNPGLDNEVHPARPQGSNAGCPRCDALA